MKISKKMIFHSTLAASTIIILFSEILEKKNLFQMIFLVKENIEHSRMFYLLKWIQSNQLFERFVQVAMVLSGTWIW
jgi:hypothetical protein